MANALIANDINENILLFDVKIMTPFESFYSNLSARVIMSGADH
jgi:hypothetical protein